MPSEYSDTWFRCFLDSIDPDQTRREVDFLARQLPVADFHNIVDLCCGSGRHARLLAERGYCVTGVDSNTTALAAAREAGPPSVTYNEGDMRDSDAIPLGTDAVLCMWQSFGYFDQTTNRQVLANIANRLQPGGRFVLDVYHRDFFITRQGTERPSRGGDGISQTRTMHGPRLVVELRYPDTDDTDRFDWHLYTPIELEDLAAGCGLATVLACADWDEAIGPSPTKGRMQFVFEKRDE